jgi:Leucine-rich repeat (LRR) protein
MAKNGKLKAYVRYDGTGRIIPGSLILNRFKPAVGKWEETPAYECCNPELTYNFDITANWSLTTPAVIDESSFRTFLESGTDGDGNVNDQTGVVITDFLLEGNRLRCNVSSTGGSNLAFTYIDVTDVISFGNLQVNDLSLYDNQITSVDNTIWPISNIVGISLSSNNITSFDNVTWPSSLQYLSLGNNQIITFNPTIPLPTSLIDLDLQGNLIVTFNPTIALPTLLKSLSVSGNQLTSFDPSIALPDSLEYLYLSYNQIIIFNPNIALPNSLIELVINDNQMTTAGYTASEPWANAMSVIPARGYIYFTTNVDSVSGTNLETILIAKGWNVFV